MTRRPARMTLAAGAAVVALLSLAAVAYAFRRADLHDAATAAATSAAAGGGTAGGGTAGSGATGSGATAHTSSSSGSPRCIPSQLNASDVLPGTGLAVSPLPNSYDASPQTQISMAGAPVADISALAVSGSESGTHTGRLLGYSQGDGASFLPVKPFRSGETVTVSGRVTSNGGVHHFAFHFVVAYRDFALAPSTTVHVIHDPQELQHFQSRPELEAPILVVTQSSAGQATGDLFAAAYGGPGPSGPEIFEPSGNLIWFEPLPEGEEATDLQVQELGGQPVLTYWQGKIPPQGFGQGEGVILNSAYQRVASVHPGNGFTADLHEFRITPQGTAIVTVFDPIYCNISGYGGSRADAVTDSIYQEIDLKTGLVRREWHSLDHVSLNNSYSSAYGSSAAWPFDYFHLNSIDPQENGTTLISSRNTSALYELDSLTGQVVSEIGGKHSSIKLSSGAATAYQHDANVLPGGDISLFDNGGVPDVHSESRGLILSVSPQSKTVAVAVQYALPQKLLAGSQGSMQVLENGNVFIGWGAYPYFSEFTSAGQLLYEAHWHGSYESYRTFRFNWTGAPAAAPAIAARAASASAPLTVYASWNGDTRTASWRVLGGPSAQQLKPVASAARSGFETAITTPAHEAYVAVQALSAAGAVLGTSATIAG